MISIVIASVSEEQLIAVKNNIDHTIGIAYEILSFNNADGKMSLCEIYNKGARKAKYEVICFMHEDIEIKTLNWGKTVKNAFDCNSKLGVIGVVGSAYKTFSPSGWGAESELCQVKYSNYIQSYKHSKKSSELIYYNPTNASLANVVTVDGMWICSLKDIVLKNPFDEILLKGFHCYDLDFCLSLYGKFDVVVTFDVIMQHFSEGTYTKEWIEDTLSIHRKFKKILPLATVNIEEKERFQIEKRAFRLFIETLFRFQYSLQFIKSLLKEYYREHNLPRSLFYKLTYYTYKFYLNSIKRS